MARPHLIITAMIHSAIFEQCLYWQPFAIEGTMSLYNSKG